MWATNLCPAAARRPGAVRHEKHRVHTGREGNLLLAGQARDDAQGLEALPLSQDVNLANALCGATAIDQGAGRIVAIKDAAGFPHQGIGILISGSRIAHEGEHLLACCLPMAGDGGCIASVELGGPLAGQWGSGSGAHERPGKQGDGDKGLAYRQNQGPAQVQGMSPQIRGRSFSRSSG